MEDNHYVLVVHGTWNRPGNPPEWHQLPDDKSQNSCTKLNDLFETRYGMGRPVWRSGADIPQQFDWGGENDHAARQKGGSALRERIEFLAKHNPSARIHLVGHSHGCNVILKGIEEYLFGLSRQSLSIVHKAGKALQTLSPNEALKSTVRDIYKERWEEVYSRCRSAFDVLEADLELALKVGEDEDALGWGPRKLLQWLRGHRADREWRPGHLGRRYIRGRVPHERFRNAWLSSTAVNRLGRCVFLGPPFMNKRWLGAGWWSKLGQFLDDLVTAFVLAVLGGLMGSGFSYLAITIVWNFAVSYLWFWWGVAAWVYGTQGLIPEVWSAAEMPFEGLNPFGWSWAAKVFAGLCGVGFACVPIMDFRFGRTYRNTNLYFDEEAAAGSDRLGTNLGKYRQPASVGALPLPTLVVSAGLLDEVALGFSSEPFIYGYLTPQIRSILQCSSEVEKAYLPEGEHWQLEIRTIVTDPLSKFMRRSRRSLQRFLFSKCWPGVEHWLSRKVLDLVSAPAFGMVPQEFTNARLEVTDQLEIHEFFTTHYWSVEKLFLTTKEPKVEVNAVDTRERYEFLWNKEALKRKMETSKLWEKIAPLWGDIERRAKPIAGINTDKLKERLARVSLVWEEKKEEVRLRHCAYYQDQKIIEGIAEFIATGRVTNRKIDD